MSPGPDFYVICTVRLGPAAPARHGQPPGGISSRGALGRRGRGAPAREGAQRGSATFRLAAYSKRRSA